MMRQGRGQRRWQIGRQSDRRLVDGAPLKILSNFEPTHDWVLDPGDMLYLPPEWAHNGTAIGECMTYSIGFRSPSAQELGTEFLTYLQEHLQLDGRYADPDLKVQKNSARICDAMVDRVGEMVERLRWNRASVADFLGRYLTEPKADVFFDPPAEPIGKRAFTARIRRHGLRLDRRSILLYHRGCFYLNGEIQCLEHDEQKRFKTLAHRRSLSPSMIDGAAKATLGQLYQWYVDGFAHPGDSADA